MKLQVLYQAKFALAYAIRTMEVYLKYGGLTLSETKT
jgi:hypothetical protein